MITCEFLLLLFNGFSTENKTRRFACLFRPTTSRQDNLFRIDQSNESGSDKECANVYIAIFLSLSPLMHVAHISERTTKIENLNLFVSVFCV